MNERDKLLVAGFAAGVDRTPESMTALIEAREAFPEASGLHAAKKAVCESIIHRLTAHPYPTSLHSFSEIERTEIILALKWALISAPKEDANNYCRILKLLGLEEEGDPVEEIEALQSQWKRAEAKAESMQAALDMFGPINGNRADTSLENWFPLSAQELERLQRKLGEAEKTNAMLAENWTNTERLLAAERAKPCPVK